MDFKPSNPVQDEMTIDLSGVFDVTEIWEARKRISGIVYRMPLVYSSGLSERTGSQVYLKMECWQRCGCFKVRGAVNHISSLTPEERSRGLVTASSGNHALAVAFASQLHGDHPTRIYVPEDSDPAKVKRILAYGPDLVYHGRSFQEAYDEARRYADENGSVFVHSHTDPKVIAGQGTIGLEVMEDLPDAEAVIVPVGGGGLIPRGYRQRSRPSPRVSRSTVWSRRPPRGLTGPSGRGCATRPWMWVRASPTACWEVSGGCPSRFAV